jgi:hypothetical protein
MSFGQRLRAQLPCPVAGTSDQACHAHRPNRRARSTPRKPTDALELPWSPLCSGHSSVARRSMRQIASRPPRPERNAEHLELTFDMADPTPTIVHARGASTSREAFAVCRGAGGRRTASSRVRVVCGNRIRASESGSNHCVDIISQVARNRDVMRLRMREPAALGTRDVDLSGGVLAPHGGDASTTPAPAAEPVREHTFRDDRHAGNHRISPARRRTASRCTRGGRTPHRRDRRH